MCVLTHPIGGPHGITVTVGTGGTYKAYPAGKSADSRQFAALKFSAVVV